MLDVETLEISREEEMPSFNHSYLCLQILLQLSQNPAITPLPELTLNLGQGVTPDISVYPSGQVRPNFLRDIAKYPEMPVLAIEVISASQNIQDLLEKAAYLVENGVKAVWTVEPFGSTIFVTTKDGETILHNQSVESEGIEVDFKKIFGN
jgi:Uma2 family endonuclease